MRLEDMLKNVSGITNKFINSNCWDGQFNVLEGIQVLQCKVNEIITAINNGIIKGDKGDTPNVKVGETTTLDPNSKATVSQTGDMLNPIFNFGIPKGEKGDKGDTGKASESINDNLIDGDHTFSSEKITTMFNSLQDVKGLKYGTDKDYLVMKGTKNGVVKDLKIKGRSLVNYGEPSNIYETTSDRLVVKLKNKDILTNSQITFVNFSDKMMNLIIFDSVTNSYKKSIDVKVGVSKVDISNTEKIDNIVGLYSNGWKISDKDTIRSKYVMLIGDYTQNPPNEYFEGIASVGNGNEIEVLSVNTGNIYNNIFSKDFRIGANGTPIVATGHNITDFLKIYNFDKYYIKSEGTETYLATYDKDKNFIKMYLNPKEFNVSSGEKYIRYSTNSSLENLIISPLSINPSHIKQDKKPILFKDVDGAWKPVTELRGIDFNSCDILDSTVNKLYRKYINVLLNGSEDIITYGELTTNTIGFKINSIINFKPLGLMISDKLRYLTPQENIFASDIEGISMTQTSFVIRISKSKLETQDVAGFKKWLQSNPLTVIYQLAQEKIYEVNPLDLQSFENETMISFKYGVVNGESEFYVDSNLGSITLNTMERVSNIENEVFQVKKIVLNGDYRTLAESTYPQDFKEVK